MKSKTLKQILATTVLTSTLLITSAGISNAALQSNPNIHYKKADTPVNWISIFRKMEETGGVMGLSETLKTDLTASSLSNNIDIHMVKSTEYGAVAILSASGYGNPSNAKSITTTTGNATGVMVKTHNASESMLESVAGGLKNSIFSGVNTRYFDAYDASTQNIKFPAKVGDALGDATSPNPGCNGWHSADYFGVWLNGGAMYFARCDEGLFSYNVDPGHSHYSRGVVVVGEGL